MESINNIYKKMVKCESVFINYYLEEIDRLIIIKTETITIKNKSHGDWDIRVSKRLPAKYWSYLFTLYKELLRYKQYSEPKLFNYQHHDKKLLQNKIDLWINTIPVIINIPILSNFKKLNFLQKILIDKFNINSIPLLSIINY